MNPSDELMNVILRFYGSETSGDVGAVKGRFSHQSDVLEIGGDPNEWWTGFDTIARILEAQSPSHYGRQTIHYQAGRRSTGGIDRTRLPTFGSPVLAAGGYNMIMVGPPGFRAL